nr:hypothetical protein Ade03nite_66570 [Actinoplanes derwentensis]
MVPSIPDRVLPLTVWEPRAGGVALPCWELPACGAVPAGPVLLLPAAAPDGWPAAEP